MPGRRDRRMPEGLGLARNVSGRYAPRSDRMSGESRHRKCNKLLKLEGRSKCRKHQEGVAGDAPVGQGDPNPHTCVCTVC